MVLYVWRCGSASTNIQRVITVYILVPVEEYINDEYINDDGMYDTDIIHLRQIDQPFRLISEDYVQSNIQFNITIDGSDYIILPYTSYTEYLEDCVGFLFNTGTVTFQYAVQPYGGEMYTRIDSADDVVNIDYNPSRWYPVHILESLYDAETEYLEDTSDGEFPYTVHNRETGDITGYIYSEY